MNLLNCFWDTSFQPLTEYTSHDFSPSIANLAVYSNLLDLLAPSLGETPIADNDEGLAPDLDPPCAIDSRSYRK